MHAGPGRHDAPAGAGESKYQTGSRFPHDGFSSRTAIMLRHLLLPLVLASSRALVDAALPAPPEDYDVLQYIDPLIGSANGGMENPTSPRAHQR